MDYQTASETFKKYVKSYPRGDYSEMAKYYVGQSLFMSTPEPRLDQTETVAAINAFQEYMDLYPDAKHKEDAQNKLFELQDKLVQKDYTQLSCTTTLARISATTVGETMAETTTRLASLHRKTR